MYSVDRLNRQYEKLREAVEEPENVGPLESSIKSLQKEIGAVSHAQPPRRRSSSVLGNLSHTFVVLLPKPRGCVLRPAGSLESSSGGTTAVSSGFLELFRFSWMGMYCFEMYCFDVFGTR